MSNQIKIFVTCNKKKKKERIKCVLMVCLNNKNYIIILFK